MKVSLVRADVTCVQPWTTVSGRTPRSLPPVHKEPVSHRNHFEGPLPDRPATRFRSSERTQHSRPSEHFGTHSTLCEGIISEDGSASQKYAGKYRQEGVAEAPESILAALGVPESMLAASTFPGVHQRAGHLVLQLYPLRCQDQACQHLLPSAICSQGYF